MRYLFDTCAFIDAITDKDMLGVDVQAIMEDWDNELCISQETIREVLIKYKNKKVWSKYWSTAEEIIDAIIDESPFVVLPIQDEHFRTYANLDLNIIEDVIIELKAVSELSSDHRLQLFNYMRLTHSPIGLLINFGSPDYLQGERYMLDSTTNLCYRLDRNMKPL